MPLRESSCCEPRPKGREKALLAVLSELPATDVESAVVGSQGEVSSSKDSVPSVRAILACWNITLPASRFLRRS